MPVTPEPVRLSRLAWSPDGSLLAVGSASGVYLYETATWRETRFMPLEDSVINLAFSFDGKLLGTETRRLEVWRVADGSLAYRLSGQRALAASPTEGLWATYGGMGGATGKLQLWRASDGQLVREIPAGRKYGILQGLAFSSDGQLIASTARDAEGFVVSRVADGRVVAKAPEDSAWWNACNDLAFRPGDSTMAVIGDDDLLALWNAQNGSLIRQLTGPNDLTRNPVVRQVRFAPDGALFATSHSAGPDREGGAIQLWQANGTRIRSWPMAVKPSDIAIGPGARLLAAAVGDAIDLLDPDDGSLVRQIKPAWHPGILPTPTPAPLHVGLNVPADWNKYLSQDEFQVNRDRFKLRYPPYWRIMGEGTDHVEFMDGRTARFEPTSSLMVEIYVGCGLGAMQIGDPQAIEQLKTDRYAGSINFGLKGKGKRAFVTGGKWSLLIPANFVEFDTTLEKAEARVVREIRLQAWSSGEHCVFAVLLDDPADITEQTRLDLARVLASMEFEDRQRPFPTATPTRIPTPNPASQPTLPLNIKIDARTYRSNDFARADIAVEIKDAPGNPVNGAEVVLVMGRGGFRNSQGLIKNGRLTTSFGSNSFDDATLSVEVFWNQKLIGKQAFVLSWK